MDRSEFERIVPGLRLKMLKVALFYLADVNEAEDIVQDALLKLWMARDKINKLRGNIEPLGITVTKNLCIDHLRTLKRHLKGNLSDCAMFSSGEDAQTQLECEENEQWIQTVVRSLPDKYRTVLHMRQVEQMEFIEIANIIGTTETSVRVILSRARAKMLEQLKQRKV